MKLKLKRFFKLHENRLALFLLTGEPHSKPFHAESVLGDVDLLDINPTISHPLALSRHICRLAGRVELLRPPGQRSAQGKDTIFIWLVERVLDALCLRGKRDQAKSQQCSESFVRHCGTV